MNDSEKQEGGVAAKLLAAQRAVGTVEKRGKNQAQKYDYVMAEDVARTAHKALLEQGLLVDFSATETEETAITSRQGGSGMIVKARCVLIVTDPESGEDIRRSALGYGSDWPGDKACYKAMTGARKYALIHLLGIPVGEDPEEDRRQPGDKSKTVTAAIAKHIVDRAWQIDGARDQLRLAASHVAERDIGDCSNKTKAQKAIQTLDYESAERVNSWVGKKAEENGEEDGD